MLSAVFVVTVNAWMNAPTGFTVVDGNVANIDPIAAMLNPMSFAQCLHMVIAAYAATGFAVAGIHAAMLLRGGNAAFHRAALGIALTVGGIAALLQPLSGDISARAVALSQPAKLASLEGQFRTQAGAPLRIGGLPDVETKQTPYCIELPHMLSFLAFHDFKATVPGLDSIPRDQWPPVRTVHLAFQTMVGMGMAMAGVALWAGIAWLFRRGRPHGKWFLRAVVAVSPAGMLAIEAGWVVTEVGRQPWLIQGVLRTRDAVTPMPGIGFTFALFCALYAFLAVIVVWLFRNLVVASGEHA
jgi:cytochrome d ubiquinol oxidase subunit I